MSLRDSLARIGPEGFLHERGRWLKGDPLRERASVLAGALRGGGHERLLTWTGEVADVLGGLAAAEEAGCDLYIAHRTFEEALVFRIADEHRISALLVEDHEALVARWPAGLARRAPDASPHDGIHVMTSGTTGMPKLARHTLASITGNIQSTARSPGARWMLTFPPTSFAGLQVLLTAVIGRGVLVVPAERNPVAFVRAAHEHGVTHVSGTPTFWRAFLLGLADARLSVPLRQITMGGEAADAATLERLRAVYPETRISQIYASTEAGVLFTVNDGRPGIPAEWFETGVGDVRLRVRDGVLEAYSPRRMSGYVSGHGSPLAGDGWLATGDRVVRQGDRWIFQGREDRCLNVGGFKVAPEEVEAVLLEMPEVAEVRVFGTPSPLTGLVVVAEVVGRGTASAETLRADLARHARARLESHKVPRVFRIVDHIPTSAFGKKLRATGAA